MIIREEYLKHIRGFYESDLIKVIVGVRRCGKSCILNSIMNEIKETTENIIYLNFERTIDLAKCSNAVELVEYVNKTRKPGKCYIFLDEIQEVENWQIALKDLRLEGDSIFVTGSNSKLLSSEILTYLSGRFVSFKIRPFVYKEIIELSKQKGFQQTINDYLIWGGMPGRFEFKKEEQIHYLSEVRNTIIFNDLIKRFKISKIVAFKKIVNYLLINNSRILSARSIQRYLNNECENISINTVLKYINYLKEAFVIDSISQYSAKAKKQLAYYEKIYDCDVSFNSLQVVNNRYDLDHNLENIVFNELLFMGYEVKTYINKGKEIDFYANKEGKSYYIQVAYSVLDEKAYAREFEAFKGLDPLSQKILITCDQIDYSTSIVKHINLEKFLMLETL